MNAPTTEAMVVTAEQAVGLAEEALDAAAALLAEAVDRDQALPLHLANYRRAKAQLHYAIAVAESVRLDHTRGVPA